MTQYEEYALTIVCHDNIENQPCSIPIPTKRLDRYWVDTIMEEVTRHK